jgi:hypothetical protein
MIRTSDIYLASYLKTKDFKLTQIDKRDNGKTFFIFNEATQEDTLPFFNNGDVAVTTFKENVQNLKQIACAY